MLPVVSYLKESGEISRDNFVAACLKRLSSLRIHAEIQNVSLHFFYPPKKILRRKKFSAKLEDATCTLYLTKI